MMASVYEDNNKVLLVWYLFKVLQQGEDAVNSIVVLGLFQLRLGIAVFGRTPDIHRHLVAHIAAQGRERESRVRQPASSFIDRE